MNGKFHIKTAAILAGRAYEDFQLEILLAVREMLMDGPAPCKDYIFRFAEIVGLTYDQASVYIRHRLKVSDRSVNFTVFDVLAISLATGNNILIRKYCKFVGLVCYLAPEADLGHGHIRRGVAEIINDMAQVTENLLCAIDPDGPGGTDITRKEAEACHQKIDQAVGTLAKARKTIELMVKG